MSRGRLEVCPKLKTQSLQRRNRVSAPTLFSSALSQTAVAFARVYLGTCAPTISVIK